MSDNSLVISERSWHYRLYTKAAELGGAAPPPPKTLCGYFWLVVLSPFTIFGFYVMRWTIIAVLDRILRLGNVAAAVILSALISSALTVWGLSDWLSLVETLGIAAGAIFLALLVAIAIGFVLERRQEKEGATASTRLVFETIRAKKRRVCPRIEIRR